MEGKVSGGQNRGEPDKTAIILEAASRVLSRYGYAGATISRVSAEAGVSRGLLHYYFRNKEDMLAKVMRDNVGTGSKLLCDIFNDSASAEHFATRLTSSFRNIYENKRDFFTLFMEGISVSRQSEPVMKEMTTMYMEFRSSLQKGIEVMTERRVINPVLSTKGLASLIIGLLDGLGLQLVMVPGIGNDNELWSSFEQGILLLMKGE